MSLCLLATILAGVLPSTMTRAQTATDGLLTATAVPEWGGGTAGDGRYTLQASIGGSVTGVSQDSIHRMRIPADAPLTSAELTSTTLLPARDSRRQSEPKETPRRCSAGPRNGGGAFLTSLGGLAFLLLCATRTSPRNPKAAIRASLGALELARGARGESLGRGAALLGHVAVQGGHTKMSSVHFPGEPW